MEQVVADMLWHQRFNLHLIGLFAGLALTLTVVGLYAVLSYTVTQHTLEIWLTLCSSALLLIFAALPACFAPARRAAKLDRMAALRWD